MKKCTHRKPLNDKELAWTRNNRSNYRIRDQPKSDIVIENGETFIRTEKRYPFLSRCTSAYERHKKIQENKKNAYGQKTKRSRCSRRAPRYNGKELKWTEESHPEDIHKSKNGKITISIRKYDGERCVSRYEHEHNINPEQSSTSSKSTSSKPSPIKSYDRKRAPVRRR